MQNAREDWLKRLYDLSKKDLNMNDPERGIYVGLVGSAVDTIAIAQYWKDHDYLVLWRGNGHPEDPLDFYVRLKAKGIDHVEKRTQGLAMTQGLPASSNKGKLKVLFLGPRPINVPALRLKEEVHKIVYRLRGVDTVELIEKWGVQFTDITGYLLNIKPEIVHISGHGTMGQELIFENDRGEAEPVSQIALSSLFSTGPARRYVKCILLNSCYLEDTARALSQHIDFVIGTDDPISDSAAIAFAESFYETLAHGESIKDAFDVAKSQFIAKKQPTSSVPTLHIRNGVDSAFRFVEAVLQAADHKGHGNILVKALQNHDKSSRENLTIHGKPRSANSHWLQKAILTGVNISSNLFTVEIATLGKKFQVALPITAIEEIWENSESHYEMRIRGRIEAFLRSSQLYELIYLP